MITARNYAAQAERDLNRFIDYAAARGLSKDANILRSLQEDIRAAQHFALPDGGVLFDDDLRGLTDPQDVKMPYQLTTVEWYTPPHSQVTLGDHRDGPSAYSADLLLVRDLEVPLFLPDGTTDDGFLTIAFLLKVSGAWIPYPERAILPRKFRAEPGAPIANRRASNPNPKVLCRVAMERFISSDLVPDAPSVTSVGATTRAVLELCEALTCSNVRAETIEGTGNHALNAKRIRLGKLPFYETKILTIEAPASKVTRISGDGHHAPPRQHLRRGHIRRLPPDHLRKIWVNSCVVGDQSRGRIDKQYEVVAHA